jgi:death-on-curing protein
MAPRFLSLDEVAEIHADQLERYGGSPGIRDVGLLQSAIAMPESGFGDEYLHADLFEMAAAYLFHIVQNHPFIDANKRVGAMSAYAFLKLNGLTLTAQDREFESIVLSVAQGKMGKAAVAEFLRKHAKKKR